MALLTMGQAFCELYPLRERLSQKDSHYLCYALTHVIYALSLTLALALALTLALALALALPGPNPGPNPHPSPSLNPNPNPNPNQVIYALNNFGERSLPASLLPAPASSQ